MNPSISKGDPSFPQESGNPELRNFAAALDPRLRACEKIKMQAASTVVRPSRRPPCGLLRMRKSLMALRKFLILRACESFASMGFGPQHLVPQSSRRPLYVVKFLPKTKRFTGSEEAARRPSRRTHSRGCSLHFDFLTCSFAGMTYRSLRAALR